MKYLYKYIVSSLFLIFALGYTRTLVAQDKIYNWQLGFGIGYTNYYGDLSNYRIHGAGELYKIYKFGNYNSYYQHQPSLSILLQKKITPTLGIMFQANYIQFAMSDRYRKNNGSLDSSSANFSRSLNFQNTMQDVGLAFTFSPNNGRIGSETAFFYPSFYIGAGVSKFVVKGDLYDSKNSPYNYRLPGNINDGDYETNLRDQLTETDNKFRDVEPYIDLGLALNFRINSLLTIALQSDIKYSASDYLDDVSSIYKTSYPTAAQAYAAKPGYNVVDPLTRQRGDNNGVNDFYINNRVVLNISLSRKKVTKSFNSPVIYALGNTYMPQKRVTDLNGRGKILNVDSAMLVKADSLRTKSDSINKVLRDSLIQVQYFSSKPTAASDSTVMKQLDHINVELKDIRDILREQQIKPRLQQLQYQTDSIKNLRVKVLNQRPVSRESNLLLRVYDLQIDSLRNEYEKAQLKSNRPVSKADSAVLFDNNFRASPISLLKPEPVKTAVAKNTNDSIAAYNNYLRRIDSIQNRLNQIEKATPVRENPQQSSKENTQKIIIDSVTNTGRKDETARKLKQQDEAIASLKREQKSANDSIEYYKRLRETSAITTQSDTVKKKNSMVSALFGYR